MARFLTMEKMARELGVSRVTVSSVVSGHYLERGISEATARRVREHLAKRGYVPSLSATNLRSGERQALGILYRGHLYSHLIEAFNMLVERHRTSERRLEMFVTGTDSAARGFRELISRGVSQVVWLHSRPSTLEFEDADAILAYLGRVETVIYNYRFDDELRTAELEKRGTRLVGLDREVGFRRLGRMLRSLGHSTVALPHDEESGMQARASQGLTAAGLKVHYAYPRDLPAEHTPEYAARLAESIILAMREDGITACAFLDDELAGFTMKELVERGVRMPRELTVTGFDGMPFSAFTTVPLTTLAAPVRKMVDCVEGMLAKTSAEKSQRFPLELIERSSHGPAPRPAAGSKRNSK